MLKNNFYTIQLLIPSEQGLSAVIHINPDHEIFKGHFPDKPVVPGVCMIQIVKELLEEQRSSSLLFQKGNQIKFLQLLVPVRDENIEVNVSWRENETGFQTTADFKKEGVAIFKLSGVFTSVNEI
ncbi:3-hydroxyacyl-ACP dehydratase [Taibaiella lutea]|uniref:3-hydroxyacyl-ACP dehydratase n=1 Tax=Taibaiella lutea TaxID=2608001 RepID=A0A5M6CN14_9BACT|nr:3-hydroxyacyl-ACP dehydratase [Taibaiella lutea]KAA5536601.1 3-hydroxyacyl-ACP dehydratase [Taibaiella lutea]